MNSTVTRTEMDGKCVIISDERKRQVRAIIDAGKVYYCGNDIAACMGYSAPYKAITRAPLEKVMLPVPWTSKRRKGVARSICFDKEQVEKFVGRMETGDDFREWLFGEVIPQAEAALHIEEAQEHEDVIVPVAAPQTASLIEALDQIIMDAALLKRELRRSV